MKCFALVVMAGVLFSGAVQAECLVREPGKKVILTTKLKPVYEEHTVVLCTEDLAKEWEVVGRDEVFNIFASQPDETRGIVPIEVIEFVKFTKNKTLYRYWY